MNILPQNKEEFELCNINVWQKDNQGEGITIVVLDKGDKLFDNMAHYNTIIPFEDDKRDTDHGTAVIASGYRLAPNVRVIYMSYLSNNKKKECIDWIIEHQDEIDLINCSFHGAVTELQRLKDLDIPIICASGNDGNEDRIPAPAKYDWTIAVGSTDDEGRVKYYSNGGKELIVVAPSYIYYPNSKDKPIAQTGTSISTPFVSFALALYLSWRKRNGLPKLGRNKIKNFILENVLDLYEEGHDYKSGYGLFRLPSEIPETEDIKKYYQLINSLDPNEQIKQVGEYTVARNDSGKIQIYNKYGMEVVI